ncbi:MAG TPA: FeoA domain-containing protein [Candidatus Bathyarchaeia archaeon]|nr:FeoA domain-containing protein [Candidatus Bathyarchaeia archaeon]
MADADLKDQSFLSSIGDKELEKSAKSLLQLEIGEMGIIVLIVGGRTACKRLNEMGLVPGVQINLVNKINSGPVMIKVKGSKLALGRGLASKVMVV